MNIFIISNIFQCWVLQRLLDWQTNWSLNVAMLQMWQKFFDGQMSIYVKCNYHMGGYTD